MNPETRHFLMSVIIKMTEPACMMQTAAMREELLLPRKAPGTVGLSTEFRSKAEPQDWACAGVPARGLIHASGRPAVSVACCLPLRKARRKPRLCQSIRR